MTAIPNDAVKDLRECFGRTLASRLPPHIGRLGWDAQQLAELPVMTKQQMMAGFDDLLTERRVTRARAEQQLAACAIPACSTAGTSASPRAAALGCAACSCRPPRST
jgi:hypothetical protein